MEEKHQQEPGPHGQYVYCWACGLPMLAWIADPHPRACCSHYCEREKEEHYR